MKFKDLKIGDTFEIAKKGLCYIKTEEDSNYPNAIYMKFGDGEMIRFHTRFDNEQKVIRIN